jgi:tellurite resistance protein TerC
MAEWLEQHTVWAYILFNLFVLAMLALDLGVFHRKDHKVGVRESLIWTVIWIALAAVFAVGLYYWKLTVFGADRAADTTLQFVTGYLIEKSLSIDNVFVFLLLFAYFKVPDHLQHRVLFWGIIGALIFRSIFIALGAVLIAKFHWIMYLFGGILILTGIKMALSKDKEIHPERNPLLRLFRRFIPVTNEYHGRHFFVKMSGKWVATPLMVALVLVESSDIIFAVDSIPAIFAVSRDPFIVYTANVFAILGLRSLYFALAGIMNLFHHLHYGLSAILIFVGIKMLLSETFKIPVGWSLLVIGAILLISVVASKIWPKQGASSSPAGR